MQRLARREQNCSLDRFRALSFPPAMSATDQLTAPADAIPRRDPKVLTLADCWRAFVHMRTPPLLAAGLVGALALRLSPRPLRLAGPRRARRRDRGHSGGGVADPRLFAARQAAPRVRPPLRPACRPRAPSSSHRSVRARRRSAPAICRAHLPPPDRADRVAALLPHPSRARRRSAGARRRGSTGQLRDPRHLRVVPLPRFTRRIDLRGRYYRSIWRGHRLHHYKNEHYWFGVTSTVGDHLLRTAPDQTEVQKSNTARTLGMDVS